MRNFHEILQSLKPLISWRSWWGRKSYTGVGRKRPVPQALHAASSRRAWGLGRTDRRNPVEWRAVESSQIVHATFGRFRDFMYDCNRRTKIQAFDAPHSLWETGKLAGDRPYFYLQPWNDRGYLFEQTPRGWVVARAEKIAMQSQFVRERLAWDHVVLHEATDRPGLLRVSSELMGEGIVSLRLYEDFMSQAFVPKN